MSIGQQAMLALHTHQATGKSIMLVQIIITVGFFAAAIFAIQVNVPVQDSQSI